MRLGGAGEGGGEIDVATDFTFTVKTTGIVDTRNNNECSFLFLVWLGLRKVQSSKQDNRISTHPPTHSSSLLAMSCWALCSFRVFSLARRL